MRQPGPLKVFSVILRPSPAIVAAHVAIVAWAGYLGWTSPLDMRPPYVVLLLCQSFAAATGFSGRARRGHFDQLLVVPVSRTRVGIAHAVVSTGTGLTTWFVVAAIEAVANHWRWPTGLTIQALSALLYMSAVAWAAALPFGRYSSGVVWLIVAIVLAGAGKLLILRQAYIATTETAADVWRASGAALIFPPLMVSEATAPTALSTFVVLAAAIVVFGIGVIAVELLDIPLVDPS
jgi:hypothetical protein